VIDYVPLAAAWAGLVLIGGFLWLLHRWIDKDGRG
jgi:hypothetical protein